MLFIDTMKVGDLVSFKECPANPETGIITKIYYGYKWPLCEVYFFDREKKLLLWEVVLVRLGNDEDKTRGPGND